MNLKSLFNASVELRQILKSLEQGISPIFLYGSDPKIYTAIIEALVQTSGRNALVYFEDEIKAQNAALSHPNSIHLPPKDFIWHRTIAHTDSSELNRKAAFFAMTSKTPDPKLVFTSVQNAIIKLDPPDSIRTMSIEVGSQLNLDELLGMLVSNSYKRVDYVQSKGELSLRGGILDIFPPDYDDPIRIEFFGDDIDSIRFFDTDSQMSTYKIEESSIRLTSTGSGKNLVSLDKYMDNPIVFLLSSNATILRMENIYNDYINRVSESVEHNDVDIFSYEEALKILKSRDLVVTEMILKSLKEIDPAQLMKFGSKEPNNYYGNMEALLSDLRRYQYRGYKIQIIFNSQKRMEDFVEILKKFEYDGFYEINSTADIKSSQLFINYIDSKMELAGFVFDTFKAILLTEQQIYGDLKRGVSKRASKKRTVKALNELKVGDYVVHIEHGIGVFKGIEQICIKKKRKDFFKISYAGDDNLYVPVESTDSIQKYIGGDVDRIKINKLGGNRWATSVANVRKNIEDITDELIELYAERQSQIGFAFSPDSTWQKEFEDQFPYEETVDQLKSAEEIKADMQKQSPMDRLLCGDVGFGKTEVALRAAFKATLDSKQVAILVPTTVLSQQHYNNIKERFSKYPLTIEMVSRFKSAKEIKQILSKLKDGRIDIIIGTHRLLSKDVDFRDLGLLIIDEEQRFGVKHKEKIKSLKSKIDVLTLTATPIPRTLHMAMVGVRDMSVLEDPPEDRYPVQTYVMEYDEASIREAIIREVERGGQVYFVHNRIDSIQRITANLVEMMPDISFRFVHGKMPENQLEQIMIDFMNNEFSVLVTTTIIESGLDISNVNTIIIDNGDNFGLSQLYQLRGRVGRSNRVAYCYVFFKENKVLTEIAEKRLKAIREFTDLGAGFKIAMKDLEIRGAGNMLGTEQSGYMNMVGYDLYCQLLDEALSIKKGAEQEMRVSTTINLAVDAYLPEDYVLSKQMRIQAYKMISAIDSMESKLAVYEELQDRYGTVPTPVENLLALANIKSLLSKMGLIELRKDEDYIALKFSSEYNVNLLFISKVLEKKDLRTDFFGGEPCELRIREVGDLFELEQTISKIYSFYEEKE